MAELIDLVPVQFKWDCSKAEKLILKKAPTGEFADMRSGDEKADDPANADNWPESRSVRAKFLEWLLRDKKARDLIHDKGIIIFGIRINGGLDLYSLTFPFPLNIRYSYFADKIDLRFACVKLIVFEKSHFNNFHADGLVIEQSADFNNSRSEGEFLVVGANIGGDLVCNGAKFINKKGHAFSGDKITTKGPLSLEGTKCLGEIRLVHANIGGSLLCDDAKFMNKNGDSFNGDRIATKGNVSLKGMRAWRGFRLVRADIGASLGCHNAKFINKKGYAFSGDAITTKGDVFLNQIESKGEFRLVSTHIGGDLYCEGALFQNEKKTALLLTQAQIDGRLCLDGIKKIDSTIDLENTKAGALRDDDKSWPDLEKGNLILDGFEYGSFADKSPKEVKKRLKWLKPRPPGEYIPQPYQQLAKVYRKMGRDRDAKKVLLEKERMRRKYGKLILPAKIWSYFLDLTIGYGYRIGKALGFVIALILLGTLIFDNSKECKILPETAAAASEIPKPQFNAFFYSTDIFVPFLDLHQEKYWMPDAATKWGWWLRLYYYFHIVSGWVFSTLLVASFTGLIRRE